MNIPDLSKTPWRVLMLSERRGVWCLIDADDYDWIVQKKWNFGWKPRASWKFYAKRNVGPERSTVYLHREIMIRAEPHDLVFQCEHHVDHINGCSLDNRKDNLRWLTPRENTAGQIRGQRPPTIDQVVRRLLEDARAAAAAAVAIAPAPGLELEETF